MALQHEPSPQQVGFLLYRQGRPPSVARIPTDGVEQVELTAPRDAVTAEGARTEIVSISEGRIQAMNGDIEPAATFPVDRTAAQASASDYDALLMPGGTVNGDKPRVDTDVRTFVQELRVAQTGVQILFAFLLTLSFTERFARIDEVQRWT